MPPKQSISPIDQALSAVLRGAYRTRGLTQAELAERTGITLTTIQRLMAANTGFTVEQTYAIAAAINWKTVTTYLDEAESLARE